MGPVAAVPMIMSAIGTIIQFTGQNRAAEAAKRQALQEKQARDFEAAQMAQQAGQEMAAAQRSAMNEHHRATLIASRAMAVSASQGGTGSDPAVVDLLADIGSEGAYRGAVALYQGEDRARSLRMGADAKTYEGDVAIARGEEKASAYRTSAYGSLFSGGASLLGKYGMGGPKGGGGGTQYAPSYGSMGGSSWWGTDA